MDEDIIKVIAFIILFVGGIIADIVKKRKAKEAEEAELAAERQSVGGEAPKPAPVPVPYTAPAPPKRVATPVVKPAKPKNAMAEESEWLSTLAAQKRRDAAKAAAKSAAPGPTPESGITVGSLPETRPFTISAQQAVNGFILSEILGPPVSMR